jgi:hypothetical protein
LVEEPCERDGGRFFADLGAELLPALELRSHVLVARLRVLAAGATVGRVTAEHAARERAPRNNAEAVAAARREHFELDRARRQVVEALLAHETKEVARLRGFIRLRDVPAREVAAADVDDFALRDERFHRLPDLVPRRRSIDVVHLVEVDAIGLHALQARVARVANVSRREQAVVRPLRHRTEHFRREHNLLASTAALREPRAEDRFGSARALFAAVPVCRIEEVDAEVERAIHDVVCIGLSGERAEVHGAQADGAHA